MSIQITSLNTGLTIISHNMPALETVSAGIWFDVGSRSETKEYNGISHFVEHMVFKGTKSRSPKQIVDEIENTGGYINAYTSRDNTAFYVRLLKEDLHIGIDLLADILLNSTFEDSELEREQKVVIQEIMQSIDDPDDYVYDLFAQQAFNNQPIGRSILGIKETVESFTKDHIKSYMEDHYNTNNAVVVATGNVDHDLLVSMVENKFAGLSTTKKHAVDPAIYNGGKLIKEKQGLEQAHSLIGFKGYSYRQSEFYAQSLLSSILGGGMSSRIFQEIREVQGLAYSVYSFIWAWEDLGVFGMYAGCETQQSHTILSSMKNELEKIAEKEPTTEELERAKKQAQSAIVMALESTGSRCEQIVRQWTHHNKIFSTQEILQMVNNVTPPDIKSLAHDMLSHPTVEVILR